MKKYTSEFGEGFIYNIMLFSKHWWRHFESLKHNDEMAESNPDLWDKGNLDLWFNAAGDHFYDFKIPEQFKRTKIGKLAKELQEEAIERRFKNTTIKEFEAFFEKLEELCILIDKKLGLEDVKAEFN